MVLSVPSQLENDARPVGAPSRIWPTNATPVQPGELNLIKMDFRTSFFLAAERFAHKETAWVKSLASENTFFLPNLLSNKLQQNDFKKNVENSSNETFNEMFNDCEVVSSSPVVSQ